MYILTYIFMLCIIVLLYLLKQLKNKIIVMEKLENALFRMGDGVAKTKNIDEVYSIILNVAVDIIPNALKGSILILEGDGLFHIRAVNGFSEELNDFTFKREEIFLYSLNNFKKTAIINNPTELDARIIGEDKITSLIEKKAFDLHSTISSPIYIDSILIGLLNVDSMEKNKEFTNGDLQLMNYIKNELQLALKNSMVQNKLSVMANFDYLTQIYNRRHFNDLLCKEVEKIHNSDGVSCLVLIDIDDFKSINDKHGHAAGDNVLKAFAEKISDNVDKADIYGRMSGDEFVILFVNTNLEKAKSKMKVVREAINNFVVKNIHLGFSYGISEISSDSTLSADEILAEADRKMYNDKKIKLCRRPEKSYYEN